MLIKRDLLEQISEISSLEVILLWGARQVGKTTLLDLLDLKSRVFLDDLTLREQAQRDPAFFLENFPTPCLIDEIQYAPNLFPELKLRIDNLRRKNLKTGKSLNKTLYYITGSNRSLLDKNVKESLAGRASLFTLHGLSVRELYRTFQSISVKTLLTKGGFPELYIRNELSINRYLDDYVTNFVEKDIARSAGIEKYDEFLNVLRLLAARSGHFLNVNEVATLAGVDQKTVASWIGILQKNFIVDLVSPFSSNLSKRIIKMKKFFFLDVGLCARLQGHQDQDLLWHSPQAGALFETLVFSEIEKTKVNFLKEWQIFSWRTKDKDEVDFIIQSQNKFLFIESKLGIQSAKAFSLDNEARKVFSGKNLKKIVVTAGGEQQKLDEETTKVSIFELGDFLLNLY